MPSRTSFVLPLSLLALALTACPEDPTEEPRENPDASEPVTPGPDAGFDGRCSSAGQCPVVACQVASCEARECVYAPADDGAVCSEGSEDGWCFRERCETGVRFTRALALVADFSDRKLEDWSGQGFTKTADVRRALDEMQRHWWWASHGVHRMEWDIARITLDEPAAADAFSDWASYRAEVVRKARQAVDFARYDADGDGVLDAMWILSSSGALDAEWLMGGMSRHEGANVFVDRQASQSVAVGATGNYNHEAGHCLGLPDLYGPFGTQGWLTFMADSWALPPNGLTAFDRAKLGWIEPKLAPEGKSTWELAPAEDEPAAVKVPTARPYEYFLVEYRKRPKSGYGSTAKPHDGLAVYHVFEPAHQRMDPPLLKTEPADGQLAPDAAPTATDFWSPENSAMKAPFVGKSHVTGEAEFQLGQIARTAKGLRFEIERFQPAGSTGPNLLKNPGFEAGAGSNPEDWWSESQWTGGGGFALDPAVRVEGARSARLEISGRTNDVRWVQPVDRLTPGQGYLLCGQVKGANIVPAKDASMGANVSVMGGWTSSRAPLGTFDWTELCAAFEAETSAVTVACRLGFYGSEVTGKAWCDQLSLVEVGGAFP